jgi:hypothetical protein
MEKYYSEDWERNEVYIKMDIKETRFEEGM